MVNNETTTRALLVDDDPAAIPDVVKSIEDAGISCDVAADASQALQHLRRKTYSVALLDYHLRSETTLYLASHIQLRHPGTKIITLTGSSLCATGYGLSQLGTDFLFRKPFAVSDLIEIMKYLASTAGDSAHRDVHSLGALS